MNESNDQDAKVQNLDSHENLDNSLPKLDEKDPK